MNKMTELSQYFKGRTVQEQMDEVIGYVDKRAEEVAATKADAVLQPAEDARTAAQAAAATAEAAKDETIAALPQIRQDISGLKAEDVALDGRLDTVELKVTTAEGNIVTIQGQIVALQTADGRNVKLTDNQTIDGVKTFTSNPVVPTVTTGTIDTKAANGTKVMNELDNYTPMLRTTGDQTLVGVKKFGTNPYLVIQRTPVNTDNNTADTWHKVASFNWINGLSLELEFDCEFNNAINQHSILEIRCKDNRGVTLMLSDAYGTKQGSIDPNNYVVTTDDDSEEVTIVSIFIKKLEQYSNMVGRINKISLYGYSYNIANINSFTFSNTAEAPTDNTHTSTANALTFAYRI